MRHQYDETHCESSVQLVPQALPVQTYGAQLVGAALLQLPRPSHSCPVTAPPEQVVVPHAVLDGYSAHAPAPLHAPLVPQVELACWAHSLSGSSPVPMLAQTPLLPEPFFAALHAWQSPAHAVSQQ